MRPLRGLDCNLERNLESTFKQNYVNFEIICGIESVDDAAYQVYMDVARRYPNVKSRIIVGINEAGINPKVNNLVGPYNSTNAELIWIVDSNITVLPDCLANAVAFMDDPRVGLVHHVPVAVELGTLGAFLDGAFLSCSHFRLYTFINAVKVASCIIGKSTMFRKQDLDQFGGISTYAKFLSEDNAIGVDLWNMNRRHVVGQDLAYQSIGNVSLHDFFERRIRWIRVRKHSLKGVVLATYYEPFTECLVSSIVGSLSFNYFFGVNISSFVTIHWVCWFLVDMIIASVAYRQAFAQKLSKWFPIYFAGSWLLREVIALPAYLWAMNGNTIVWRGHIYILNSNGTITAKKPKSEK